MGLDPRRGDGETLIEALRGAAGEIRSGGGLRQDHAALAEFLVTIASRIDSRTHGAAMLGHTGLLLDAALETRVLAQALLQAFDDNRRGETP